MVLCARHVPSTSLSVFQSSGEFSIGQFSRSMSSITDATFCLAQLKQVNIWLKRVLGTSYVYFGQVLTNKILPHYHFILSTSWFAYRIVSLGLGTTFPTHVRYKLHESGYNLHEVKYNLNEPEFNLSLDRYRASAEHGTRYVWWKLGPTAFRFWFPCIFPKGIFRSVFCFTNVLSFVSLLYFVVGVPKCFSNQNDTICKSWLSVFATVCKVFINLEKKCFWYWSNLGWSYFSFPDPFEIKMNNFQRFALKSLKLLKWQESLGS